MNNEAQKFLENVLRNGSFPTRANDSVFNCLHNCLLVHDKYFIAICFNLYTKFCFLILILFLFLFHFYFIFIFYNLCIFTQTAIAKYITTTVAQLISQPQTQNILNSQNPIIICIHFSRKRFFGNVSRAQQIKLILHNNHSESKHENTNIEIKLTLNYIFKTTVVSNKKSPLK